jgi:protoheme ferro-lyase
VSAFVQQRMCDARRMRWPWLPDAVCRPVARLFARSRTAALRRSLTHVGGAVPEGRLLRDLAALVEETLATHHPQATWTVAAATAYGAPSMAEAADRFREKQVDRIVAVPLVSVWVDALSGALVDAWTAAQHAAGLGAVPLAVVRSFSEQPGYAEAIRERIGEALQRFPRPCRDSVHVVFALHPDSHAATPEASPLFDVVHRIVPMLAAPHHAAFARGWGRMLPVSPSVDDEVTRLLLDGARSLVVVPIGYVLETMDTAYDLDVGLRATAERLGAVQYEVTTCLNLHEAFVGALASVACDALGVDAAEPSAGLATGRGAAARAA